MKNILIIITLFFFIWLFSGSTCNKENNYPIEPKIEYLDFIKYQGKGGKDTFAIFKFGFTDGNGDIGLDQNDTSPPFDTGSIYYYNLFIEYFERQKGVFVKVEPVDPDMLNCRIPPVTDKNEPKPIRGEIEVMMQKGIYWNPNSPYDTIKYTAYIVDRELHQSNKIETPPIVIIK